MCGICGVVGPAGRTLPPDPRSLHAMRDSLRHRGPDGPGELTVASADGALEGWLGHRRLKIIDLTEHAHQPMTTADGQVSLTFNGEVYNFRELRQELAAKGHRFESTGDTEVVLRAYEEWGERCVERLDGMFAFAVWDGRRGQLLLARDRPGKKPLFYYEDGGRLAFGSEIKALRQLPWVPWRPNAARVPELLTFGYVPGPETFLEGVRQVPPASTVVFDAAGAREPRAYWSPVPSEQDADDGDLVGDVRRLLEAATARRMVADVPLGALLSGGIDSSVVVALMSRIADEQVRTFTIGFPDERSFDERGYARLVADHLGTRHTEHAVTVDSVALLDRLLWFHDQPFGDSSAIPTYLVSELARSEVTVALNGDGGDEVFGGYDRFKAVALSERVPAAAARAALLGSRLLPRGHGYGNLRRRIERFANASRSPVEERYAGWVTLMAPDLLGELVPGAGPEVTASLRDACARGEHLPVLDRILLANFATYLPDDLAVKIDRMSMAHSLEARSPFLDTPLIDRLSRVPAARKVGLRRLKPLLRAAFGPLLPKEIWDRPKHGFGVPVDAWFAGELGTMFEDEVLGPDARTHDLLDATALSRMWEEQRSGQTAHGQRLWTILTLERWLRQGDAAAEHPPAASAVSA